MQPIQNTPLFDQLHHILPTIPPVTCILKLRQHGYVQNMIFSLMQVGICGWGGRNKFPAAASRADGPLTQSYNILTKKTPLSLSVREEFTHFIYTLFQ